MKEKKRPKPMKLHVQENIDALTSMAPQISCF